jgi:hypothetical protein
MNERVLAWEGDVNTNPRLDEDVTVVKTVNVFGRYGITTHDIAKVKKCCDTLDHVCRDMSGNCTKINLYVL